MASMRSMTSGSIMDTSSPRTVPSGRASGMARVLTAGTAALLALCLASPAAAQDDAEAFLARLPVDTLQSWTESRDIKASEALGVMDEMLPVLRGVPDDACYADNVMLWWFVVADVWHLALPISGEEWEAVTLRQLDTDLEFATEQTAC